MRATRFSPSESVSLLSSITLCPSFKNRESAEQGTGGPSDSSESSEKRKGEAVSLVRDRFEISGLSSVFFLFRYVSGGLHYHLSRSRPLSDLRLFPVSLH